MKTNEQVAQAFARGDKAVGKNFYIGEDWQGNLTAYSYGSHFPVCTRKLMQFDDAKKNTYIYLFNTATYSNTTARHQRLIKDAIKGHIVINLFQCKEHQARNELTKNKDSIDFLKDRIRKARSPDVIEMYKKQIEEAKEQNSLIEEYILPYVVMDEL